MAALDFNYRDGGIHFPGLGLWLDAHRAIKGEERVVVSHAHSDHTARHREVLCSPPTARLMQERLGGNRLIHELPYSEPRALSGVTHDFRLTLEPAGHILGSAMALLEADGRSLLFTGDFSLRSAGTTEACRPRPAEVLIMETTYGRPRYVFPPVQQVTDLVVQFCRETLGRDETPVLLGYALGKSQTLLAALREAGLPLALHPQVLRFVRIYESFGWTFPPYRTLEPGIARGSVCLCPPNVHLPSLLPEGTTARTAALTGWAMDPAYRFRFRCDTAFPLSDHADFNELLELVRQVAPRRVFTLHGFAADFAQALRERGYDAHALSEPDQLQLDLFGTLKPK